MKKLFLLAAACAIYVGSVMAQFTPSAGDFSTEIRFIPWSSTSLGLNSYGVKGRYFISDKMAIRANIGFDFNSSKDYTYYGTKEIEEEWIAKTSGFSFLPGIEFHTSPWERISVYGGLELGIAMRNASTDVTNWNGNEGNTLEVKGQAESKGGSTVGTGSFGFVANAFTGIDFYITPGLYLGAEFGLGFNTYKTKEVETTTKTGSSTSTTTDKDYSKNMNLAFYCVPSFRLGWKF